VLAWKGVLSKFEEVIGHLPPARSLLGGEKTLYVWIVYLINDNFKNFLAEKMEIRSL